ncbi:MAG: hypothetical protein GXP32_06820 [Kiritimatiellaeota bacterium]|nr:hypothetical protein [Kiritimatiellota bacterium]
MIAFTVDKKARIPTLLAFFTLFSILSFASELPSVDRPSLRFGSSPRMARDSWATLSFRLNNPTTNPVELEVRMVDKIRDAIYQRNIFSAVVTVPPGTRVNYRTLVKPEESEEYQLDLFLDGRQISSSSSFLTSMITGSARQIPVLNDSDESLGAFAITPAFKGVLYSAPVFSPVPFEQWEMLDRCPVILMVRPDFSRYSEANFRAVMNYVRQGGCLVFADPIALLSAMDTPLAELLPVKPLKLRKVRRLNSFTERFKGFENFRGEVDFLETAPVGDGLTLLSENEHPVIRVKRYGLGRVVFSAVPIRADAYVSKDQWLDVFKFFISHQKLRNDTTFIKSALDQMTGFSVPRMESVRNMFLVYFLLLAIPLSLGFFLKKTGLAWLAAGVVSIFFMFYFLEKATSGGSSKTKKKDGLFVSFIQIQTPGDFTGTPSNAFFGLLSPYDNTTTLRAENHSTVLSALPLPENRMMIMMQGFGMSKSPPTQVRRVNGVPELPEMHLATNASRQFYAGFSKVAGLESDSFSLPEIEYTDEGFVFKPWKLPEGMKVASAWVQFADSVIPLKIDGDEIIQSTGTSLFDSDTITTAVRNLLEKGWKHSSPILFIAGQTKKSPLRFAENAIAHGLKVTALPIRQIAASKIVRAPGESITICAGDTASRMIMNGNEIKPNIVSRSDSEYLFRFELPPFFSAMRPTEIEVELRYANSGNNIILEPSVFIGRTLQKKFIKSSELKGVKTGSHVWVFKNASGVFSDFPGRGVVALKAKLKNTRLPMGARLKANTWTVEKLKISVKGEMPPKAVKTWF